MNPLSLTSPFRKIGFSFWLLLLSILLILVSLSFWIYAYYPRLGHDYTYWIPQLYEFNIAWKNFDKVIYDFSPVRCLGLPSFSHPNTLQLSLFHIAGLAMREIWAIQLVFFFILLFSFFGVFLLCRHLLLEKPVAILLALGWVLQGWIATRVLVGHVPFIHLALAPWILFALISRRNLFVILAAAFWLAHTLYSAAFYTTAIMLASISLGLAVLRILQPDNEIIDWKRVTQNFFLVFLIAGLICLPKVIGSLDFLSLFPREHPFQQANPGGTLLYALSNLFYPFPYNISRATGWQYGSWESYQYLLPLLFPALTIVLIRQRTRVSWKPVLLVFAGLTGISVLLTSGLLGNLFSALPILKSFHVNPRWNGVVLLPMLLLAVVVMRQTGFLAATNRANRLGLSFFFATFSLIPLLYVGPSASWGIYPDGIGIHRAANRIGFCYEPIFGYDLENFPGLRADLNWIREPLRNPRCLLKSGQCEPGSGFSDTSDQERLVRFDLDQPNTAVRWLRPFSLLLYAAALVGMLVAFTRMAIETVNQCRDGDRS